MANKPLRPCRHPGCNTLVPGGWCDAHRPPKAAKAKSAEWHWMYLTPKWLDDLRPGQLLREPFCRECAKRGLRVRAVAVDHIRPHLGDWAVFCDPTNLQSLCESCHNRKTAKELAAARQKRKNS